MDDDGQTSDFLGTKAIHKIGNLQYTYSARLQYIYSYPPQRRINGCYVCICRCVVLFFSPQNGFWLLKGPQMFKGLSNVPKGYFPRN